MGLDARVQGSTSCGGVGERIRTGQNTCTPADAVRVDVPPATLGFSSDPPLRSAALQVATSSGIRPRSLLLREVSERSSCHVAKTPCQIHDDRRVRNSEVDDRRTACTPDLPFEGGRLKRTACASSRSAHALASLSETGSSISCALPFFTYELPASGRCGMGMGSSTHG